MNTLHLFNPGHDEALAAGTPYYTDTKAARLLADDLAELPRLWAAAGDVVVGANDLAAFRPWDDVERIEPWGWDAALVHRLRRAGAPERLLPSAAELHRLRRLSSRRTAVEVLQRLNGDFVSRWCTTPAEALAAVAEWGESVLKAPWSSSGRGVFRVAAEPDVAAVRRLTRLVEAQGGIEVEPFYAGARDFAVEYLSDGCGGLSFEGFSVFDTTAGGNYAGNLVADDATLLATLGFPRLAPVLSALHPILTDLFGTSYCGPLGVDMLLLPDGRIHPCLEINLRRTMGFVALALRPRHGRFCLRRKQPSQAGEEVLTPRARSIEAVFLPTDAGI